MTSYRPFVVLEAATVLSGTAAGITCLQWEEPSDPHTWRDNYLCL